MASKTKGYITRDELLLKSKEHKLIISNLNEHVAIQRTSNAKVQAALLLSANRNDELVLICKEHKRSNDRLELNTSIVNSKLKTFQSLSFFRKFIVICTKGGVREFLN